METREININGIGPILLQRSERAEHVSITIRPSGEIRVAVPQKMSFKNALEFVHQKKNWIQKHLTAIRLRESGAKAIPELSSDIDIFETRNILNHRLAQLAEKYGFIYNRVTIRNQKTRWGSCSAKNNISLNIALVKLPRELMDYVILHELVHTRRKRHNKIFWSELDKYTSDSKAMAARLKKYSLNPL
jgi:predicted metal-dependent hydrolase